MAKDNSLKTYLVLVSAILLLIILLLRDCGGKEKLNNGAVGVDGTPSVLIDSKVDTIYKEKRIVKYVPGETILKDTTIFYPIPRIIDTVAILKDYYSKSVYLDSLDLDSAGFITVRDTISRNRIISRHYVANLKQMTIKQTDTYQAPAKKRGSLWVGFGINSKLVPEAVLQYSSKKDWGIQIGASNQNNQAVYQGTFLYRLTK